jgi:CDGSH-type Zn-finger protein
MNAFRWTFPFLSIFISAVLATSPVWGQSPGSGQSTTSGTAPIAVLMAANDAATVAPAVSTPLQIRVLNPESLQGVLHNAGKEEVRVEVTDETGAAVRAAAVICRLPESGATGTFADGTHAAVAYTDEQGQAAIRSIQWGDIAGPVAIRLTATKGMVHAGILVETTLAVSAATETPAMMAAQQVAQTVVTVPTPQPGQLAKDTPAAEPAPIKTMPPADPTVSVTRTPAADAPHSSHGKLYVLLAVIGAAGAGAAFAMKGKSTPATTTNTSSLSIGAPTISVGHP